MKTMKTTARFPLFTTPATMLAMLTAPFAVIAANTFTAASGDWNTAANWSEGVPAAGQEVVVNGNATLTNATPALASLTVNSAKTLTFDGWDTLLTATTVTIAGTVTHAQNTATTTNSLGQWVPNARVNIACDDFILASTGKVDIKGKGYRGGLAKSTPGSGPGGGRGSNVSAGGGYGGMGGHADMGGAFTYGSHLDPVDPGSGGALGQIAGSAGAGGGALRIVAADEIQVNGIVDADGVNGSGHYGSGGSGGGVTMSCRVLKGSGGKIYARGGTAGGELSGAGGGGRIAIVYDTEDQSAASLPGIECATSGGASTYSGDLGTLYFPDSQMLTRPSGAITQSGQWMAPGFTGWERPSLTLNNAWLRFPHAGFELKVTNDLVIAGTDNRIHKLELSNAVVRCSGNVLVNKSTLALNRGIQTGSSLYCAGFLMVSNSAAFHVQAGIVANPQTPGAWVSVTGEVVTAGASWIYPYSHPTNGGSVAFHAASFTFGAGGGINAAGLGYKGGDKVNCRGYGPGGGWASNTSGGGSYGGLGGSPNATSRVYGDYRAPIDPGSGGGSGQTPGGGAGGGAVLLETTGAIRVDGSILADAPTIGGNYLSAGSGGGIYLQCRVLRGTGGVVSANGGSFSHAGKGGGGGGRIAVVYDVEEQDQEPLPAIRFSTLPGSGTVSLMGDIGTLYFPDNQLLVRQTGFVVHSGQWTTAVPMTGWTRDSLVVSNGFLRFPHEGFALNVAKDITVWGTDAKLHKLEMSNAVVTCGGNVRLNQSTMTLYRGEFSGPSLNCASNFVMDGSSQFHVHSGLSSSSLTPGATVDVGGAMTVGATSWVYPYSHPTNGGSVRFRVGGLNIPASDAGFDATGRGFAGGPKQWANGYGPGGGWGATYAGGAGYGGLGGGYSFTNAGVRTGGTYGLAFAPFEPGSGGGTGNDMGQAGGAGGGVIRIESKGDVVMNGSLLANAYGRTGHNGGGGSGGGIFVTCRTFSGTGAISANGEASTSNKTSGGGGGGRIAVWLNVPQSSWSRFLAGNLGQATLSETPPSTFTGTATAGIGAYSRLPMPTVGTVVFLTPPPMASLMLVR